MNGRVQNLIRTGVVFSLIATLCAFCFTSCNFSSCGELKPMPPTYVIKVVLLYDGTLTLERYKERIWEQVTKFLENALNTPIPFGEKHHSEIVIITVDAFPTIIWKGTLQQLKKDFGQESNTKKDNLPESKEGLELSTSETINKLQTRLALNNKLQEKLNSRSDYTGCTDIVQAFNLAVDELSREERGVKYNKYIYAVTDLVTEPPNSSLKRCVPAQSKPPQNFPWDKLQDINVSVYWVPSSTTLVWKHTVQEHNLSTSFTIYTVAESSAIELSMPQKTTNKRN